MKTQRTRAVRAEAAPPPGTRERVLQAAWDMIGAQGDAAISLVDVAQRAGVSRQTLYLLFGSRAGLLLAMVEHADERAAILPRLAAARTDIAMDAAFEPYVRVWFEYLPVVFPVARALAAAAVAGDGDARAAWESRTALLRAGFRQITKTLIQAGALRPGWTAATAADWLFTQTQIETWQHLVVESGWKPRDAVDRVVASLREVLLEPLPVPAAAPTRRG